MATVLIGLGANLGDCGRTLQVAVNDLQAWLNVPVRQSGLWRTLPVQCASGTPDFMNAVMAFEAPVSLVPTTLLAEMQRMEVATGRPSRRVLNESRLLDLDLLAFGAAVMETEALILPHPRAHLRHFVMVPASEVAADFVWPGTSRIISELLADLPADEWGEKVSWPGV